MSENNHLLPSHINLWQQTNNWTPSARQQQQWQKLYSAILVTNKHLNLTRITTVEDFWEKNLWDCVAPVLGYDLKDKKIIDLGTGGGFPGLPLALAFPDAKLVLVDSTAKKINFINDFIEQTNIENVTTLVSRVEVVGQHLNHREQYDFVTIRAVSQISVCLEYSLPLLKIGGVAILYRGNLSDEERITVEKVAERLGGKVVKITNQNTPINQNTRHCIYVEKIGATPNKYPRQVGTPTKKPLS